MESSSSILQIGKLTSEIIYSWKQKVSLVLSYRELDEIIDAGTIAPNNDEYATLAWKKLDRKSIAIIGLSPCNAHLHHVASATCAGQMWGSLLDIFDRHTLLNELKAR